jgi:hypothetical protein
MCEFGGYDFVNRNAKRDSGDIRSTPKQKIPNIDSVFITFHPNDKNKVICVQPFIDNFKLTAEDACDLTCPAVGIVMNTWIDTVQYKILLDAMNFSNNSMVGLPREFINSCKGETIVTAPISNGLAITAADILKQDLTNFLLAIPFAADSTHTEDKTCTDSDAT